MNPRAPRTAQTANAMSLSGVLPRQLAARNRHSVQDRTLGTLAYVNGWWYGRAPLLGATDLRVRIAGTLDGPEPAARRTLCLLDAQRGQLKARMHPHLWANWLERCASTMFDVAGPHKAIEAHYRIEAACAGAFGEHELVELAIRADWGAAPLGLYLRRGKVVETTPNLRPWLWPA